MMDPQSALMFGSRSVVFEYERGSGARSRRIEKEFFGRRLKSVDYAELTGAPTGASITVRADEGIPFIHISVPQPLYAIDQTRLILRVDDLLTLENEYFATKATTFKGTGARVFARQVEMAARLGIQQIKTFPTGDASSPIYNGYYTWPRLGYNISVAKYRKVLEDAGFFGVQDTIDLFGRVGGAEWWKANAKGGDLATFDLTQGSRSQEALAVYLVTNKEYEKWARERYEANLAKGRVETPPELTEDVDRTLSAEFRKRREKSQREANRMPFPKD